MGRVGSTLQKLKEGLPSGPGVTASGSLRDEKKLAEVKTVLRRLQRIGTEPERDPAFEPIVLPGLRQPSHKPLLVMAITGGALLLAGAGGALLWSLATDHGNALNLTLGKDQRHAPPPATPSVLAPAPTQQEGPSQLTLGKDQRSAAPPATASLPAPTQDGSEPQLAPGGDQQAVVPPTTASILPPVDASRLAEADLLMERGQVAEARRLLESLAAESPEAALMLARSYDPNYLRTIAVPDVGPDVASAEHWYRIWHQSASGKGLLMEPERLDRIIRAMR